MAFSISTKQKLRKHLSDVKDEIDPFIEKLKNGGFFADDAPLKKNNRYIIKTSKEVFNSMLKLFNALGMKTALAGGGRVVDFRIRSSYKIRIAEVTTVINSSKNLAEQEKASLLVIKRALGDGVTYKSVDEMIEDDAFYKKLARTFSDMDDKWLQSLFQNHVAISRHFQGARFDGFDRDGGMMKFITEHVRSKFNIQQKDTWNPADIWLSNNQKDVIKELKKASNLEEFNDMMRTMYQERKLVGISLKLISGSRAYIKEVNIKDARNYKKYSVESIRMRFDIDKATKTFGTSDTTITVGNGVNRIKFQMRQNDKKFSNLKFEPTNLNASASMARLGKAPVGLVTDLMKEYGRNDFSNNWRDYPQTVDAVKERMIKYERMFAFVNSRTGTVTTNIATKKFVSNVLKGFNKLSNEYGVATSKLMQLEFVYNLLKMKSHERDDFLTKLIYLSEKRGTSFGPHLKIY